MYWFFIINKRFCDIYANPSDVLVVWMVVPLPIAQLLHLYPSQSGTLTAWRWGYFAWYILYVFLTVAAITVETLQFHTSCFLSPCVAWWRRSTTQPAAALRRLYNFTLPLTMPCMVETQYDAACCVSTASLIHTSLHTSYFRLPTSFDKHPCYRVDLTAVNNTSRCGGTGRRATFRA